MVTLGRIDQRLNLGFVADVDLCARAADFSGNRGSTFAVEIRDDDVLRAVGGETSSQCATYPAGAAGVTTTLSLTFIGVSLLFEKGSGNLRLFPTERASIGPGRDRQGER